MLKPSRQWSINWFRENRRLLIDRDVTGKGKSIAKNVYYIYRSMRTIRSLTYFVRNSSKSKNSVIALLTDHKQKYIPNNMLKTQNTLIHTLYIKFNWVCGTWGKNEYLYSFYSFIYKWGQYIGCCQALAITNNPKIKRIKSSKATLIALHLYSYETTINL